MNVGAHAISCRASSLLPCGFSGANSLLVQEIQPAKDIDLTCFKTFPIKATTCSQVGPMSLDWPVDPIARFDQSRPSSSPEDPNDEQQRGALPTSARSRWRQGALQPPQMLQDGPLYVHSHHVFRVETHGSKTAVSTSSISSSSMASTTWKLAATR